MKTLSIDISERLNSLLHSLSYNLKIDFASTLRYAISLLEVTVNARIAGNRVCV